MSMFNFGGWEFLAHGSWKSQNRLFDLVAMEQGLGFIADRCTVVDRDLYRRARELQCVVRHRIVAERKSLEVVETPLF